MLEDYKNLFNHTIRCLSLALPRAYVGWALALQRLHLQQQQSLSLSLLPYSYGGGHSAHTAPIEIGTCAGLQHYLSQSLLLYCVMRAHTQANTIRCASDMRMEIKVDIKKKRQNNRNNALMRFCALCHNFFFFFCSSLMRTRWIIIRQKTFYNYIFFNPYITVIKRLKLLLLSDFFFVYITWAGRYKKCEIWRDST